MFKIKCGGIARNINKFDVSDLSPTGLRVFFVLDGSISYFCPKSKPAARNHDRLFCLYYAMGSKSAAPCLHKGQT